MVIQCVLERSGGCPEVKFEASDHGDLVLAGLTKLRDMEQLFDVTLMVENERFQVHRVVLASCSEYFRAMFTDGLMETSLDEIRLNGVTATGMKNLIDFAYSSKIVIDSSNVEDVLSAANHIQILPVIEACVDYLKTNLSLLNCVDMVNIAELFELKELRDCVYKYMSKNLQCLSMGPEFFKLTEAQMVHLLQANYPVECPEVEVLSAAVSWLTHHSDYSQAGLAYRLLSCINFCNVTAEDVQSVHNSENVFTLLSRETLSESCNFLDKLHSCNSVKVPGLKNTRGFEESLVVCGGFTPGKGMTNAIQVYQPGTGTMASVTSVPHVEQCNFGLAMTENCLYVVGGCYNDDQMEEIVHAYAFCYCPATDKWRNIPPMLQERCRFYLGTINSKLYAVGGDPSASLDPANTASCEIYDPEQNVWSQIAPLPGNRMQHAGTVYSECLYVSGGLTDSDGPTYRDFYQYNIATDTWHALPDMPTARADHAMFTYNDKIYVIGGWFEDTDTQQRVMATSVDQYDPETNTWESVDTVPHPRLYATYTVFRDELVVVGGWLDGDYQTKSSTVERYDLANREWTEEVCQDCQIWEHVSCSIYLPTCRPTRTA